MSDTPQLIKEKLDIVEFLRGYLKLLPAGKNFKALCPFHKEKTPSFMVSPDRGVWHCFGCSVGGDVIKFLMMYENLEFYDALKILAEKAGVEMKTIANRDFQAHNNLYKIMEAAKNFFKKELAASQPAQQYLSARGLKKETIEEFELGLAPNGSDVLMRHLIGLGFNVSDVEKAGLVLKTERGTYWDRFRSRLMFPIHNHFGKVVGFTGRLSPSQEDSGAGKYVNSPETPIYQKSKILYGFFKTKNDIRQNNSAVLVEGQMDFLMAWQDGIKNVVATSGTALTPDYLTVLRRISDSLVIGFDSDEAGVAAGERAIDLAGAADFNVRVLLVADSKDPAELAQKEPGRLNEMVASALPAMQYYFFKHLNSLKSTQIIEKKRGVRAVLAKIAVLASAVERDHWLKELAGLTGVEESALAGEMEQVKVIEPANAAYKEVVQESVSRKDLICQRIIGLALNRKELQSLLDPHLEYIPPIYRSVLVQTSGSATGSKEAGTEVDDLAGLISLRASLDERDSEQRVAAEFQELLRQLRMIHLKEKSQKLTEKIRDAETKGDEETVMKCQREQTLINQEKQNL